MLMEKYNNLISAYAGDEDALEIIKSDMKRMNDYVNVVYNETYLTPLYRVMYNDQELRDRIQALDSDRRTKHDLAIMAVGSSCFTKALTIVTRSRNFAMK